MTRTERLQYIATLTATGDDSAALRHYLSKPGISKGAYLKAVRRGKEVKRKLDAGMLPYDAWRTTA